MDPFFFCYEGQMFGNDLGGDPSQIKPLAPAQDCWQDSVGLGGCENEFYMGWRLFQRFEQRVKRLRRQHVNLVDDIELELSAYRCEPNVFAQLAHLVDTVVAGAIDLENI